MVKKIIDEILIKVVTEIDNCETHEEKVIKNNPSNSVWTCPLCLVEIKQKQNVQRHINLNCSKLKVTKMKPPKQATSPPVLFKCKFCTANYPEKKTLTAHMKLFHIEQCCLENKSSIFQCTQCNFKTLALKYLRQHITRFHTEEKMFTCEMCERKYSNKDSLRVHVKNVHLVGKLSFRHICEVCGTEVSSGSHACPSSDTSANQDSTRNTANPPPSSSVDMVSIKSGNQEIHTMNNKNPSSINFQQILVKELPSFLGGLVKFPCMVQVNSGGGPSLYRAAAQHVGLGEDGWQELRKYCNIKLAEWWQWYQPYYIFPLKLSVVKDEKMLKTINNSEQFLDFLKTPDSLHALFLNFCEQYCLANIIGVPIHQLSYTMVQAGAIQEAHYKWSTVEPHPTLAQQNQFHCQEPLFILYEENIKFNRIIPTQ